MIYSSPEEDVTTDAELPDVTFQATGASIAATVPKIDGVQWFKGRLLAKNLNTQEVLATAWINTDWIGGPLVLTNNAYHMTIAGLTGQTTYRCHVEFNDQNA